jgi:hypothetical protein
VAAWFHALPDWMLVGIVVVVCIAASLVLMRGLRAVLPVRDDKETFDFAIRVMPTILSVTAFILAFAIVQAQSQISRTETTIASEATAIEHLDRLLLRLGADTTAPARAALHVYAASVIADEWPYMRAGGNGLGHKRTHDLLLAFEHTYASLAPSPGRDMALFNDVIRQADALEDLRDARLRQAGAALPSLFWGVIGFLTLIVLSLSAFFKPNLTGIAMVGSQAAALGTLIGLLFALDHPFRGETSIPPALLERVTADLSGKP